MRIDTTSTALPDSGDRRHGRRALPVALAILAGCLLASVRTVAIDYYRWRGPDLNGVSKETGWASSWPQEGPRVLWRANVGTGFSSVSVSQGRAYTMGNKADQDTVYCFDAATGKEVWKHSYPCPLATESSYEGGPHATPTVDGNRVYTVSKRGHLFCFAADTGRVVWSKNLAEELGVKPPRWAFAGSVLVQGDRLFVNVGKYGTALDKSGKVLWTTGAEPAGYSTHVPYTLGDRKGLAVFGCQAVAAVDPETGQELWSHPWKTEWDVNAADPIISGDLVFISSGYNHGAAVLRIAGKKPSVVWEDKTMRNHFNSCVLIDGCLYGFDQSSDFRCIDLQNGALKWSEKNLGLNQQGAVMAADQKLIILGGKGELIIAPADPSGFKPLARAQVLGGKCWTTPVLSNGRIYCRNAAGDLVCLDVSGSGAAR